MANERRFVTSSFIYDGLALCGSELATISPKQTLDYVRRLIAKLCFRAEEGGFGAPNNLLSGMGVNFFLLKF